MTVKLLHHSWADASNICWFFDNFVVWNDWIECCMHVSKWSWIFGCWLLYRLLRGCPLTTWTRLVDYGCSRPKAISQAAVTGHATLPLRTAGVWNYRRLRGLCNITLVSKFPYPLSIPFSSSLLHQFVCVGGNLALHPYWHSISPITFC